MVDAIISIYAISDIHFNRISLENYTELANNWPETGSIVVIAGDTERPSVLKGEPFNRTINLLFPGNHDGKKTQDVIKYDLADVILLGGMGFNYKETPWAHSHIGRTHSEPFPFIDNLRQELEKINSTTEVMLVTHFPPIYFNEKEKAVLEENFEKLLLDYKNVSMVITGHVHGGIYDVPHVYSLSDGRVIPFLNVAAPNTGYRPIYIWKKRIRKPRKRKK